MKTTIEKKNHNQTINQNPMGKQNPYPWRVEERFSETSSWDTTLLSPNVFGQKLWPLIYSSAKDLEGKFCPACHFLGAMGFMHIITPPWHLFLMKLRLICDEFRITVGKLPNFVTLWVGPGVPLDQSSFSELFEAFVAVLESYRTWEFCGKFSFHLLKAERKRLIYRLLTGSFTVVHTAVKILSKSLKYFFSWKKWKYSGLFPMIQSSSWVSHNHNRSALPAGYKCHRDTVQYILFKLDFILSLSSFSGFLPHSKVTKAL